MVVCAVCVVCLYVCTCIYNVIIIYTYISSSCLSILCVLKRSLIDLDVRRHVGNIAVFARWSCFSQVHTLHIPWWHITYSQPQQCAPRRGLDGWVETFLLRHKPRYPFSPPWWLNENAPSTTSITFFTFVIFNNFFFKIYIYSTPLAQYVVLNDYLFYTFFRTWNTQFYNFVETLSVFFFPYSL